MAQKQFRIGGMTCINCQNKIEQKLKDTAGIKEISVSYSTGLAQITFDSDIIAFEEIEKIIEKLGYEVLSEAEQERPDISRTVCFLVIIIALFVMFQQIGILNLLVPSQLADKSMGYGMLFVVGLLTSVHCIAMCGGINLSQCLPKESKSRDSQGISAYISPALYNLGRVISYTAIGFLLGLLGMIIGGSGTGVSTLVQGILKLIAGTFMVIMGINMLGIFPWLRKFNLRMPKYFAIKIGRKKEADTRPLMVGLLNGLMPCGPLQSMQIIALVSGNPLTGAVSMFLFSLGTVPLMLGLGTVVSALGKRFARAVMQIGAVLVVVLGLAMISQGGNLSGMLWTRWGNIKTVQDDAKVQIVDGVQVVNSTLSSGKYPSITVQEGMPVRWIIDAPEGSINGCNYKMIIQEYGIEYSFEEGENVITFTPANAGTVPYTCWMGMIRGNILVTDADTENR